MPVYGHVWFCMGLNDLTQLCTIFVLVIDPNQSSRDPTIDVNMSKSNIRYSASGWRNMTFRVSPPRATNATCQIGHEIMYFSGQIPLLLT